MTELWLPVVGYEGLYEVSDQGRVRSLPRNGTPGGIMRLCLRGRRGRKYLFVSLRYPGCKTRKNASVHRLVAEAFIGPANGLIVLHGANGRSDNSVSNLRYGTHKENCADKYRDGTEQTGTRNGANKLTEAQVLEIRAIGSSMKQKDIAAAYGVCPRTVSVIIRRLGWTHLP